jgi:hypothetical protein
MKTDRLNFKKYLLLFGAAIVLTGVGISCNNDNDDDDDNNNPQPVQKGQVTVNFELEYNDAPMNFDEKYDYNNEYEFNLTKLQFYLSDIGGINQSGKKKIGKDIEFIDMSPYATRYNNSVMFDLPVGTYTQVRFDQGVKDELNSADPADYGPEHPLHNSNTMYWTWKTMYIFQKAEGFAYTQNDTVSWLYHTGTTDLYREGVEVDRSFDVKKGENTDITIMINFNKILNSNAELDFINDGQSHTMDNMPAAKDFVNNFEIAFE